jgi:hypothetical protein
MKSDTFSVWRINRGIYGNIFLTFYIVLYHKVLSIFLRRIREAFAIF